MIGAISTPPQFLFAGSPQNPVAGAGVAPSTTTAQDEAANPAARAVEGGAQPSSPVAPVAGAELVSALERAVEAQRLAAAGISAPADQDQAPVRQPASGEAAEEATPAADGAEQAEGAETERTAAVTGAEGDEVDEQAEREEQVEIRELQARDREVRAHEAAHLAAAGALAQGGPSFTFQRGPDGQLYAVGGEVSIDTSPGRTPEETIAKAAQIRAAALAPAEPSGADLAVAAAAAQLAAEAQRELAAQRAEQAFSQGDGTQREPGTLVNEFA